MMRGTRRAPAVNVVQRSSLLNGLLAYWPMDDLSGGAYELVNSKALSAVVEPDTAPGHFYQSARLFVPSSSHALNTADPAIKALNAWTAAIWEYPTSYSGVPGVYNYLMTNTSGSLDPGFKIFHNHSGVIVVGVSTGVLEEYAFYHSLGAIPALNAWNLTMAWHDPDADVVGVSVNGEAAQTTAHTYGQNASANPCYVGFNFGDDEFVFDGRLGTIVLWNRALTADERAAVYRNGWGWSYRGVRRNAQGVTNEGYWWLEGGITSSYCLGAYQAKGAATLAASYVNLADPGTHDLVKGATEPGFNTATGWSWSGTETSLATGIVPASGYTLIFQFSDDGGSSGVHIIGNNTTNAMLRIRPNNLSQHRYSSGADINVAGVVSSGNLCVAGQQGYLNGTADGSTIGDWTAGATSTIFIGASASAAGRVCKIQAVAIYDHTLTSDQVAAVAAAMAAL